MVLRNYTLVLSSGSRDKDKRCCTPKETSLSRDTVLFLCKEKKCLKGALKKERRGGRREKGRGQGQVYLVSVCASAYMNSKRMELNTLEKKNLKRGKSNKAFESEVGEIFSVIFFNDIRNIFSL